MFLFSRIILIDLKSFLSIFERFACLAQLGRKPASNIPLYPPHQESYPALLFIYWLISPGYVLAVVSFFRLIV